MPARSAQEPLGFNLVMLHCGHKLCCRCTVALVDASRPSSPRPPRPSSALRAVLASESTMGYPTSMWSQTTKARTAQTGPRRTSGGDSFTAVG